MRNRLNEKKEREVFQGSVENIEEMIERAEAISNRIDLEQRRDELLLMMYHDDIDANHVLDVLNINYEELESIANELIKMGYIRQLPNEEFELTKDGIFHILSQDPDIFEKKH